MRGFYIVSVGLLASMAACVASFSAGNTGLVMLLFVIFIPGLWTHGFITGRSVDLSVSVKSRETAAVQNLQQRQQRPPKPSMLRREVAEDQI